ncbi:VOC family protein [Paenarthrobacter sp. 4246]|uniref:VOC family protein n=1 Tax=Paenarthrobacter sp. 4246 TaxID=3156456 RepID=UPI003396C553
MQKISTCLWFDGQAAEAAEFYTSIFDGSSMGRIRPGPDGQALTVEFEIDGRQFMGLNGGPAHKFNEAVSLMVNCDSQEEVDRNWERRTTAGEDLRKGRHLAQSALPHCNERCSVTNQKSTRRRPTNDNPSEPLHLVP